MIRLESLTKENIASVINSLSELSQIEAHVFRVTEKEMQTKFENLVDMPFTATLCDEHAPIALWCLEAIGDKKWKCSFIFTKHVRQEAWKEITRFSRAFSSEIVKDGGVIEFDTAFAHGTGKIHRWYEAMGFHYEKTSDDISTYIKGGKPCALAAAAQQ